MNSAVLKFQQTGPEPLDSAMVAAAVEASPQPLAISENGTFIYKNGSFAQLVSTSTHERSGLARNGIWQSTEFSISGRKLSLITTQSQATELAPSDLQHLATIGRLVAGVAHDFNNLLTGILLYCDLLQSRPESAGALWKKTEEIRRAAEQGAALVRQLMTVGRGEPGEQPSVCFNQIVMDLDFLLKHLLGEQIHIELALADDGARVGITSAQAQQIILNLALNARDAMPTGGVLRFESSFRGFEGTGPSSRIFEFVAKDSGRGMDAATAARAFDPYFSTKTSGRGTGLATVRAIVEGAGGIVSAESSPGQGTRMIIRLPELSQSSERNQASDSYGRSIQKQSENEGATRGATQ